MLKEARVAKNLSLDDIQEITKIQKRYLVAIEHDDYHALPGRFYARAFIKEYAQAVGLDAAEVLQDFDEEKIQTKEEQSVQYTRMERAKRARSTKGGSSIFSFLPSIIVVVLVIGIVFVAWTLYQKALSGSDAEVDDRQENDEIIRNVGPEENSGDAEEDSQEAEEDDVAEMSDEAEEEGAASFSVVETGSGNSPLSELDFYYSGETVTISFDVTNRSYIDVMGDSDTTYFAAVMEENAENEEIDVSDEERVYFNIGDATGITIKLNGEELEYPVDPSERVHQKLWINLEQNE